MSKWRRSTGVASPWATTCGFWWTRCRSWPFRARSRRFRAYAAVAKADPRLRPGMNGGMDITIKRIPDAISIPAKALFTRAGKPVVFLAERGNYRPAEVQVLARNPDEIAIAGIPAGAFVALTDTEKRETAK